MPLFTPLVYHLSAEAVKVCFTSSSVEIMIWLVTNVIHLLKSSNFFCYTIVVNMWIVHLVLGISLDIVFISLAKFLGNLPFGDLLQCNHILNIMLIYYDLLNHFLCWWAFTLFVSFLLQKGVPQIFFSMWDFPLLTSLEYMPASPIPPQHPFTTIHYLILTWYIFSVYSHMYTLFLRTEWKPL